MSFKSFFQKKEEEKKLDILSQSNPPAQKENAAKTVVESKNIPTTNEPPAAVQLEAAMIENIRDDNKDSRAKIYQELLFSDLLLALMDGPQPDPSQLQNNNGQQNLNVAIMSNPQGVQFAAIFTDSKAAQRWRPDGGQYASIRGQDIFKILESSPAEVIVVNPGTVPFAVLTKADYKLLAKGILPQNQQSPVQATIPADAVPPEGSMQISFPADAFTEEQKEKINSFLQKTEEIEAAALGALLPPNSPSENDWLRTIFLRTKNKGLAQDAAQKFCIELREKLMDDVTSLKEVNFEVGVMPDNNFWVAMHQNNFVLFDKDAPKSNPELIQDKKVSTNNFENKSQIPSGNIRKA